MRSLYFEKSRWGLITKALVAPRAFALMLGVYWVVHYGLRVFLSDTFQIDGAEQVYLSQWLRWDYGNFQPPALTWFFWCFWKLTDPSLWSFVLVRYLILGLASWIWYRIACLLFADLDWRFLAAISWLLIGELGWKLHQGSTHTTVLILALVMTFHAICLISRADRRVYYAYLGVGLSLGILAKYTFAVFVFPAVISALSLPALRERVLHPGMLLSLVPALITGLIMLYAMGSSPPFGDGLDRKAIVSWGGLLDGDYSGARHVITGVVGFAAPFLVVVIPAVGSHSRHIPAALLQQFLSRFFMLVLLLLVGFVLFFEVSEIKVRWMHPLLLFLPFWVVGWMAGRSYRLPVQSIISGFVGLSVAAVLAGQYYKLQGSTIFGVGSRPSWPVSEAVAGLPETWRTAQSAVCVSDAFVGAQLRSAAPGIEYIAGRDPRCKWFVAGEVHLDGAPASAPPGSQLSTATRHQTAFTLWVEAMPTRN